MHSTLSHSYYLYRFLLSHPVLLFQVLLYMLAFFLTNKSKFSSILRSTVSSPTVQRQDYSHIPFTEAKTLEDFGVKSSTTNPIRFSPMLYATKDQRPLARLLRPFSILNNIIGDSTSCRASRSSRGRCRHDNVHQLLRIIHMPDLDSHLLATQVTNLRHCLDTCSQIFKEDKHSLLTAILSSKLH